MIHQIASSFQGSGRKFNKTSFAKSPPTWRIIQWLVTLIYKPFSPLGRGTTLHRELTNHGYQPFTKWDDPPSSPWIWVQIGKLSVKYLGLFLKHYFFKNAEPWAPKTTICFPKKHFAVPVRSIFGKSPWNHTEPFRTMK